jgi:hypothetical protein
MKLRAAVAFYRTKDITREALGMDADEGWEIGVHRALVDNNEFLITRQRPIACDPKFAAFCRQFRVGNSLDRNRLAGPRAFLTLFFVQNAIQDLCFKYLMKYSPFSGGFVNSTGSSADTPPDPGTFGTGGVHVQ